jgi:hypothetical protein
MEEMRKPYKVLVGEHEDKRQFEKHTNNGRIILKLSLDK